MINQLMASLEDSEDLYLDIFESETPAQPVAQDSPAQRWPGGTGMLFDFFSLMLLVGGTTILVLSYLIYNNPYTPLNPFPPSTPIPTIFIPSATPAPSETLSLPGTWTTTVTTAPTETATLPPTQTLLPSETPLPSATAPYSPYNYLLRSTPAYLSGSVMHPDESCKLWVAGQAFDMKGSPVIGITVMMGGRLNFKNVYLLSLTDTALQYGPGGYEFVLAEEPLSSNEDVWVQLLNQAMVPISERVYFNTYEDCEKNLVLVNFKQVR